MIDFWKSMAGMYEVEVTSASVEQTFSVWSELGIPIFRVSRTSDLSVCFLIRRRDYKMLAAVCEKRGDTLRICGKVGMYWSAVGAMNRPVLTVGLLLLFALALFLPTRVLFVQVSGNTSVPDNCILEAAAQCGISFGANRRLVRSEQVKNALLSAVPELKWAGVNTYGCVAVISVRERSAVQDDVQSYSVSSIVAAMDGVVTSCTATKGNLLCAEGQAVRQGQLLISGYTDCGLSIQATQAEGEVYAQTIRTVRAVKPVEWSQKGDAGEVSHSVSLLIGKKRINLWKGSGIWDTTCDRMYQEYCLSLPGGYDLPVTVCVETYTQYSALPLLIPEETASADLTAFAQSYLSQQMMAGQIRDSMIQVSTENGLSTLEGTYICTEMIGRVRPEQIGEENGKTD